MKKRNKVILISAAVLVFLFAFYNWRNQQIIKEKISLGFLIEHEGELLTIDEMNEKFPQVIDTPAKNTQLEAYTSFRAAVMSGDIDEALKYLTSKSIEKNREDLLNEKELEFIKNYLPDSEKLQEENTRGNFSYWYYYTDEMSVENDVPFSLDFEKNKEGYWQVDSF